MEARIVPSIPIMGEPDSFDPLGDLMRNGHYEERVEVEGDVTRRIQTWTRKAPPGQP